MSFRRMVCWSVVLLGLAGSGRAQEAAKLDLTHVPPGAALLVGAHPRAALMSKSMEFVPREIISAATLDEMGIDLMELEQIVAFAMPPAGGPPAFGVIARFRKDVPLPKIPGRETQLDGRPALQLEGAGAPLILRADSKTLLAGPASFLPAMLAAKEPGGMIAEIVRAAGRTDTVVAVADIKQLRPILMQQLGNAPPIPPPLQPLLQLPELLDVVAVQADINGRMNLLLRGKDAAAAEQARKSIAQGLAFGKQMAQAAVAQETPQQPERLRTATLQYVDRIANLIEQQLTPQLQGADLRLSLESNYATTGVMVALLLPAIQAAREAARRAQAVNQLKMIGVGMLVYHDKHGHFPPRYSEKDGKPLLSWRVHLLPFLEQEALYAQFHLDEPWDSPHNIKLVDRMPGVYANPNQPGARDGKTVYLVADGEGMLLDDAKGVAMAKVRDGMSNTIMAVEADPEAAVIWTKPADLPYDAKRPMLGLGHLRPGGFQAVLADGSVRFISDAVDKDILRGMFTRDGGEVIPFQ